MEILSGSGLGLKLCGLVWRTNMIRIFLFRWILSIGIAVIVLLFGSPEATVCAFGLVWLLYGLSIFVVRGFQDDETEATAKDKNNIPMTPFWQWVTGKFTPENDPYYKKYKKQKAKRRNG